MSGLEGRSGRRTVELPEGLSLPALGSSEESIRKYCAAVSMAVALGPANGGLDPRVADSLSRLAQIALQSVKERNRRKAADEKRTRVRRLEQACARLEAAQRAAAMAPGGTPDRDQDDGEGDGDAPNRAPGTAPKP